MTQAYPLAWPAGWPRMGGYKAGQFKTYGRDISIDVGVRRIFNQLALMRVDAAGIIISTNVALRRDGTPRSDQAQPADRGAAVYWTDKNRARKVMAIDIYHKVEHNLAAIATTLEAMRAIERHGGAQILERAFTGFTALAAPAAFDPWAVLGLKPGATALDIERKFRELAMRHHPDRGGDAEQFHRIQEARKKCLETIQ